MNNIQNCNSYTLNLKKAVEVASESIHSQSNIPWKYIKKIK
jgi:hypothetical protein